MRYFTSAFLLSSTGCCSSVQALSRSFAATGRLPPPRIAVYEAEEGFVDSEENLEEGEELLKAVKAFAERGDKDGQRDFLCAGALTRRCDSSSPEEHHDMWVADSLGEDGLSPNLQQRGAVQVIDDLFLHHLRLERAALRARGATIRLLVMTGEHSPLLFASHFAAQARGFRTATAEQEEEGGEEVAEEGLVFDCDAGVESYTALAVAERGLPAGMTALEILGLLAQRRAPVRYSPSGAARFGRHGAATAEAWRIEGFLPRAVLTEVHKCAAALVAAGALEQEELDSVDGAPSLHLSLVAGGVSCFGNRNDDGNDDKETTSSTRALATDILKLIRPYIDDGERLQRVREVAGCETAVVSDIFLRHYGTVRRPLPATTVSRFSLPAHFDVLSLATAVVALDDSAARPGKGRSGGLFAHAPPTKPPTPAPPSTPASGLRPSASNRLFFPLASGDALVHNWRMCHGVDLPRPSEASGESRTSLVIWFSESEEACRTRSSPWLIQGGDDDKNNDDDVKLFVEGSYLESMQGSYSGRLDEDSDAADASDAADTADAAAVQKYLRSAALGNALALCRLGTLCDEGALRDDGQLAAAEGVVEGLQPMTLPMEQQQQEEEEAVGSAEDLSRSLARRLWLAAALRGCAAAQAALGDCAMADHFSVLPEDGEEEGEVEAATKRRGNDDDSAAALLLRNAATWYALAAQQGNMPAANQLRQLAGDVPEGLSKWAAADFL